MTRKTGITKETLHRFILDAGAVFINYGLPDQRLLGATRGGNTFSVEQEVKETEIDGAFGPVAGTRRVITVTPSLTVNLLEFTKENFEIALAGAKAVETDVQGDEEATEKTHSKFTRETGKIFTLPDHIENVALAAETSSGEDGIFIIENALADGNLELATEDKNEAVLEVALTGHFDPDNMEKEPWSIIWPNEPQN